MGNKLESLGDREGHNSHLAEKLYFYPDLLQLLHCDLAVATSSNKSQNRVFKPFEQG